MLGNAPTRIVVCAQIEGAVPMVPIAIVSTSAIRMRLLTLLASNYHGQDAGVSFFLCAALAFAGTRRRTGDQVGQSCVFQNPRSGVTHIKKNLIERAVRQIAVDEHT